ncbi:hypothetical protein A9P82_08560 [Arachidicoccus ginsenosidimutans]|uniref:Imm53 family immunity protein n=1 Tax=Arachidicoccus sp. BS20 TaxID=1850526 RepID=UPI0007F0992D|nr:Imm53 family immunity protein [Arachidicoccus sp. BS20]ANI89339.1 hypothetical protein A9P82_08560 [Arachidicoccus sp. BS20]
MNSLVIIQNWFQSNCNGDWEHDFGIKIETLDNPGWCVTIDLEDTPLENLSVNESKSLSENDWYYIYTKERQLIATGDINKIIFLLDKIGNIL